MNINSLPKITVKPSRRVGRGHGSGRGKTAGRGTKGLKAHGKVKLHFEGGALPLTKRLPLHRGKGKNKSLQPKPIILNVSDLNVLPANTKVNLDTLIKHGILNPKKISVPFVKILGRGNLSVPLEVQVPVSGSARKKIEKAKGTVVVS